MSTNLTILQFFHWYYPNDNSLWRHCSEQAPALKKMGISHLWLPPAYKSAIGAFEPGYAVYDLYDLGEFDQKGSVATKYGTKEEYLGCIRTLQKNKISVLADVVLNHMMGGDETELVPVKAVDTENREHINEQEEVIEAYTKFTFPGRNGQYSNFVWDWHCFTGVSLIDNNGTRIYKISNEYGDTWEEMLDNEKGNFDYLMGSDIEFRNQFVREELKKWGKWYIETTGVDGFRLDAVKHIPHYFFKEWLAYLKQEFKRDFFTIAEYWTQNTDTLIRWNNTVDTDCQLFDVPLHFNFYEASLRKNDYDLRTVFDNSLLQRYPTRCMTFVDNHDSQPFQGLESFVDYWFKPLANAIILLREQGIPCLFYPSLYGAEYEEMKDGQNIKVQLAAVPAIKEMLQARHYLAYGLQRDYFDHSNVVGWTREGVPAKKFSGLAVLMSNGAEGYKTMELGQRNGNMEFVDVTGNRQETIKTDRHGTAVFTVNAASVSVWVKQSSLTLLGKN